MMSIVRLRIVLHIFCFVILCLFAGCAVNPVTGQHELMFVSESQELDLGNETYPNALWSGEGGGGEYKDPALKSYLTSIVLNIHRASHRPGLPVDFAVQNSSLPNAWAIPGHVVITRGLLAALDNEAEFTYVMGHEIGHVSARHSARQMTYGMMGQVLLAGAGIALAGSDYSDAALSLGSMGSGLILAKFSRNDELEADRLGVSYMSKLGYDPRYALSAHHTLEKISDEYARSLGQSSRESSFFSELMASHPRNQVRMEEIQAMIQENPRSTITGDGAAKERFAASVANARKVNDVYLNYYDKAARAFNKNNPQEAIAYLNQAIAKAPDQAPFYALYGAILAKQNKLPEAEQYFGKALNIDANYQPALKGIGIIRYAGNKNEESMQYLQQSLKLFPQDPASTYFMGMNYYKARQYKYAIQYLKPFSDSVPNHPKIHAILGQCYENTGDIQAAYKQYTMQLKVNPNNDAGGQAKARSTAIRMKFRK